MKTKSNKLQIAIDNYVRSVRILLATIICVPILLLIGYYAPIILLAIFWVPPCFIVLALLTRENEKIKEITEWTNWIDDKMASEEYLNALLYIQSRQFAHTMEPIEPDYYFTTSDLNYQTFLKEKYQYKSRIKET